MEGVLHIMQAAYGFSMHNEACRRRTNNKARAVTRYIWPCHGPSSWRFNTAPKEYTARAYAERISAK